MCPLGNDWVNNTKEGVKRDVVLRVRIKRGNGMNVRVDKSRGIVTLMTETLPNINPIEPLRLSKQSSRMKRNWTDFSVNSPVKKLSSRLVFKDYYSIKRKLNTRLIHECRCDERLKSKVEGSTLLGYTGLIRGLEHLKIETRLIDERFVLIMNR